VYAAKVYSTPRYEDVDDLNLGGCENQYITTKEYYGDEYILSSMY
jgi:hypothetical protein